MLQKVSMYFFLSFSLLIRLNQAAEAQTKGKFNNTKISCPEKWWASKHLFIAKEAFKITHYSLLITDSISRTQTLDGNINGGQLDAFKHAFWMAMLSQNFKWKKAKSLGLAHEKGNYRSHLKANRKGITEGHDQVSSEMDLWNNEKGIAIGMACKCCDINLLTHIVLDSIKAGSMKIIRTNSTGKFLDIEGNILPAENFAGKWINDKCLVPSNTTMKETLK
jgi:hypothetical protein